MGGPVGGCVQAPEEWEPDGRPSLFLAGGIAGCPDWQESLRRLLVEVPLVLLNPRQANFPGDDRSAPEAQIGWEFRHLRRASAIAFWFPAASLSPIALYELGAWSMTSRCLAVGVEPGYARERDVRVLTGLARPDIPVVSSLAQLAASVRGRTNWLGVDV